MIIHHDIVNLQSMSFIPGRSSGCFGDTGFEIVGVRDTKDNLDKVLGEPLAMLGHSGVIERQEDASPDAKKTCKARGRHSMFSCLMAELSVSSSNVLLLVLRVLA